MDMDRTAISIMGFILFHLDGDLSQFLTALGVGKSLIFPKGTMQKTRSLNHLKSMKRRGLQSFRALKILRKQEN